MNRSQNAFGERRVFPRGRIISSPGIYWQQHTPGKDLGNSFVSPPSLPPPLPFFASSCRILFSFLFFQEHNEDWRHSRQRDTLCLAIIAACLTLMGQAIIFIRTFIYNDQRVDICVSRQLCHIYILAIVMDLFSMITISRWPRKFIICSAYKFYLFNDSIFSFTVPPFFWPHFRVAVEV